MPPNDERFVDLHVHTTASDGALSPAEIVDAARQSHLAAVAITDHDTVAGIAEARRAAQRTGDDLEVIPGVELSVDASGSTLHVLGYDVDPDDAALTETLTRLRGGRDERNPRIIERLAELGLPIRYEDVLARAAGETVGRPHIARVLVDAGHARSVDEAFDRYLARGAPAYVERWRIGPEQAIELIHRAGGSAVVAHPAQVQRPPIEVRAIIQGLADAGLDGIEVWHPDHAATDVGTYRLLAEQLGLVATGGTDFHGHMRRQSVRLGVGRGQMRIPYSVVIALRRRRAARRR